MATRKTTSPVTVVTLKHDDDTRKNIPTAEYQSVMKEEQRQPIRVAYERRNRDLDPQLAWRGKDEQDWSDLVVHAPPLYIQEKVHPKALIDDLKRETEAAAQGQPGETTDLFADFNGLPSQDAKTEFYQHDAHWANRMILGDSLQAMASLAEREGLRGKVQCIYFDPPYGIKFNSNFQWSTTSRDVKDGSTEHITREPEQVKAFRDTWRDGIHSYLTYLRDRLTVARDLLTDSGSIFVQIGDENVHRVRAVMDEVFGDSNIASQIAFRTTTGRGGSGLSESINYLLWYVKDISRYKYRAQATDKLDGISIASVYSLAKKTDGTYRRISEEEKASPGLLAEDERVFFPDNMTSARPARENDVKAFVFNGQRYTPGKRTFATDKKGLDRLARASRLHPTGATGVRYVRFLEDYPSIPLTNMWTDTSTGSFTESKVYVVQTATKVVQRCVLMTTDPGDLVLDPTCGSGTSAYVAEQWGRRWITLDTSRVALALARARIMGARYPFYLLADSREGQIKEAEITRTAPSSQPVRGNLHQGFVYERVPHITLKSIANNAEIDAIWEKFQERLEPLRAGLNTAVGEQWEEWGIPREPDAKWSSTAKKAHADWWRERIARQKEIDASIAAKADSEFLYDKPYEDKKKVRVAGPFTVESLTPHRALGVDEDDNLIDGTLEPEAEHGKSRDFVSIILDNLKTSGVQQAEKSDKIEFTTLVAWPGAFVCAQGRYLEGTDEKRAAIFIGPEFGTVSRPDLVAAAREAGDGGFDVLIACAFNYDAHSSEFAKLGRIPVLKARMNADLHMAADLKNTGKGNLFVIFGEPDVDLLSPEGKSYKMRVDGRERFEVPADALVTVKIYGVDVFHPNTGEVRSDGAEGIACWFIDTDYNEESFFVRHAYFLGANDPYKSLKTTLKSVIDEDAWATLNSDTSRPFAKPKSGRIAVKVINHLGDEVMKVFKVE